MSTIRDADSSKGDDGTMYESGALPVTMRDRRTIEHVVADGVVAVAATEPTATGTSSRPVDGPSSRDRR
jgi:hypothetical protein